MLEQEGADLGQPDRRETGVADAATAGPDECGDQLVVRVVLDELVKVRRSMIV